MHRVSGHPLRNDPAFRRAQAAALPVETRAATGLLDDIKLFAMFFVGGLTFMTVYLA